MQSYFFWKTADVCQELTEVEQILRYFRRDIYTKKKWSYIYRLAVKADWAMRAAL